MKKQLNWLFLAFFGYFDSQMKIHLEQIKTNSKFVKKKIGIHRFRIPENM